MPFSAKYNCLFYHIPKAAGTSIEVALECRSGGGKGMSLNFELLQGGMMQHMPGYVLRRLCETGGPAGKRGTKLGQKDGPILTEKNYGDTVFKFTIVRNPWDKMVSQYLYHPNQGFCSENFEQYLEIWLPYIKRTYVDIEAPPDLILAHRGELHFLPQFEFIKDDAVDFIGRFENLKEDWAEICKRLGLSEPLELPHKRQYYGRDHYSEYYTKKTRQMVAETYARDIEILDYKFG